MPVASVALGPDLRAPWRSTPALTPAPISPQIPRLRSRVPKEQSDASVVGIAIALGQVASTLHEPPALAQTSALVMLAGWGLSIMWPIRNKNHERPESQFPWPSHCNVSSAQFRRLGQPSRHQGDEDPSRNIHPQRPGFLFLAASV